MKKVIIPMGYMGSGSSAITDFVSEINGYDNPTQNQEFVFLHCPDGLFQLEDELLVGNNIFISDEQLRKFRDRMQELYNKKFWWPGNYKNSVGPDFMKYVDTFLDEIIDFRIDTYWYMTERPINLRMKILLFLQTCVNCLFSKRVSAKPVLSRKGMILAYPSAEKFYGAARRFLQQVIDQIGNGDTIILDQLLLPHYLYRMERYFAPGEAKAFIVDRDPRDIFIMNKYIWPQQHAQVPYPTDVHQFCEFFKKIREIEPSTKNEQDVLYLHFEDLVYHYDSTRTKIYHFLGITEKDHVRLKERFQPEISRNNTQLFLNMPEYKDEIAVIESELAEYLYDFPEPVKQLDRSALF